MNDMGENIQTVNLRIYSSYCLIYKVPDSLICLIIYFALFGSGICLVFVRAFVSHHVLTDFGVLADNSGDKAVSRRAGT